ncbi:SRPBCC domain-containing protein [Chryseolinea sp. H1M3-3]|uniref:SRPBCC family protein n=1 Tax=Chryseolinea sp. H1M3-3 TaxID=3034144 RepID=UPI0023EBC2C8|nr:SRPBCC domain-containing protein [Chryseolinea sp. H1M3-3]
MKQKIRMTDIVNASSFDVWKALTVPALMKLWAAEPELALEIITDWMEGGPIIMKGFHHIHFENKGRVLKFEPYTILQYNFLSSLSRLPDRPENYTTVTFKLAPLENQTSLTLTLSNFPTETIYKHIDFYWRTTFGIIKNVVEKQFGI